MLFGTYCYALQVALAEVEYHKALCHPNIVECIDSDLVGVPDLVGNRTSQVLILLPYYPVGHNPALKYEDLHISMK